MVFGLFDLLTLFCYTVMIYSSVLWLLVLVKNRDKFMEGEGITHSHPSVTILVPAYNEEKHIKKSIKSILSMNYPKERMKVICINDGSTDRTLELCKSIKDKRLKIIDKPNTGKADSLNQALKFVNTDYVVSMDADSYPEKNFLKNILSKFQDKGVAAVSPSLKVYRTGTIMQKIQWLEYVFSIYLRKLFSILDCQYVLPGPGSAYKTSILKKLKGWNTHSLVEDMELAFRIYSKGYRIENNISALVWTEAPEKFTDLFRQRVRWYRGYLQTIRQYIHMIGHTKYGNLGMFVLPANYLWIFVLSYLFFLPIYNISIQMYDAIYTYLLVGMQKPVINLSFDILYIDFNIFFSILFFVIAITIIMISLHYAHEKVNFRSRKLFYLGYLFLYPIIYSIFWIAAVSYEILRVDERW